jgi:predicted DNA-binding transcriptional regulator AlpA
VETAEAKEAEEATQPSAAAPPVSASSPWHHWLYEKRKRKGKGRRLISRKEMLSRVCASYASVWKWMQDGTFPRSVLLGGDALGRNRKCAWFEDDIDLWLSTRELVPLKSDGAAPSSTPSPTRKKPSSPGRKIRDAAQNGGVAR